MKPDKGNNKKNTFGFLTILLWALAGTLLHNLGAFAVLLNSSRILKNK